MSAGYLHEFGVVHDLIGGIFRLSARRASTDGRRPWRMAFLVTVNTNRPAATRPDS